MISLAKKKGYIFKPACGRVGEKISIEEACRDDEYKKILKEVKKHPKQYLAQKKFEVTRNRKDFIKHFNKIYL